ncbi:MAG: AraC family transcriptional regulator [Kiritimatiellae bacterium]|nr:AraC family transcriptional regulator [Kiritimatiellia bacterium]MDD5519306.1 AraC family transcriptional regulator [Kiritimatiellia bacterium]
MKLIYQKLAVGSDEGFTFKTIRTRKFDNYWHFHPEYELILTMRCPGYRLVGDNISPLKTGDLVFVGANLPHLWQYESTASEHNPSVEIHLIQFEKSFLGEYWLQMPSFLPLKQLFQRASVGLYFTGKTREQAVELMMQMKGTTGLHRMVIFLSIFDLLASSREYHSIASPGYSSELNPFSQERMNKVIQYINEHMDQSICLEDAARLVHLSTGAFSRFFHQHTARTFPAFVNELRIGRACRLLAESEMNITEIALTSGFTNLSNFNRQFFRLKKTTPRGFRNQLTH